MKVAFSTLGETLESPLDSHFGRAQKFIVYDTEQASFVVLDNSQNLDATLGSGVQTVRLLASVGVEALVTGHLGPKASKEVAASGLKIYQCKASTVSEALALYTSKALRKLREPDVEGHWL
ncbi:MAG: NifB/NifX family molybdenum-iron cluster-binding protein [Sphaerochaetaceae bacterium]